MIKPLKNTYLVSADPDKYSKRESGINVDTSWNKYDWATQDGIIESVPTFVEETPRDTSKRYKTDVEISVGDKVYFHHFVVADDMKITSGDKVYYKLPRYHMYCVVKNLNIIMLDYWVLVSPIMEKEEDIIKEFGTLKLWTKTAPGEINLMGKVEHVSTAGIEQGINKGDTILFKKDSEYKMTIEGNDYYRMELANVVAVIRDNKPFPLRDEIIVRNNSTKEQIRPSGLIIPTKPAREQIEKVEAVGIQDEEEQFLVGDEVMFHHHTGSKVEYAGNKYVVLRQLEVIGAMK